MSADVLGPRALNRALLARQGLLERVDASPLEMVERLAGVQAQVPSNPYLALWSRLADFVPQRLSELLADRRVVRAALVRPTIHLVSARDCLAQQPFAAEVMAKAFRNPFGRALEAAGVDARAVADAGLELLRERPRTRAELTELLAPRWPDGDPAAIGQAVTFLNPLVQIPPRGLWRATGQPTWAPTEQWLDAPLAAEPALDELVLRYLAAFGPAAPADMRTWSRLTDLRSAFERLRPQLAVFRDERGRELFDLPDAPRPDPATPAPPRFLPEYDNVALSHDDRTRIFDGRGAGEPFPTGPWIGSILVDGFSRANWSAAVGPDAAVLTIDRLTIRPGDPADTRDAVAAEGAALLALIAPDAPRHEVRFTPEP